jgi:hypothetical protein
MTLTHSRGRKREGDDNACSDMPKRIRTPVSRRLTEFSKLRFDTCLTGGFGGMMSMLCDSHDGIVEEVRNQQDQVPQGRYIL